MGKREGFPDTFRVQRTGVSAANAVSELPAQEIARYFRQHPETAKALMDECSDKRFTPSTVIYESGYKFGVAWFTRDARYECVQEFSDLADAATDYLLFSLGKSRWKPHN